jgi:undecaprenyl pyrophosphate synthase
MQIRVNRCRWRNTTARRGLYTRVYVCMCVYMYIHVRTLFISRGFGNAPINPALETRRRKSFASTVEHESNSRARQHLIERCPSLNISRILVALASGGENAKRPSVETSSISRYLAQCREREAFSAKSNAYKFRRIAERRRAPRLSEEGKIRLPLRQSRSRWQIKVAA